MGVRIIAEPGRYFTASAFTLAVNIIAKRTVTSSSSTSSSPGDTRYHFAVLLLCLRCKKASHTREAGSVNIPCRFYQDCSSRS